MGSRGASPRRACASCSPMSSATPSTRPLPRWGRPAPTLLAVETDVSSAESVDALAEHAYEAFGAVHVLCNNAGVGGGRGPTQDTTVADWQWILGVNLWGVIHGLRSFVPRMLDGGEEGHVVNTSSVSRTGRHAVQHHLRHEQGGRGGADRVAVPGAGAARSARARLRALSRPDPHEHPRCRAQPSGEAAQPRRAGDRRLGPAPGCARRWRAAGCRPPRSPGT